MSDKVLAFDIGLRKETKSKFTGPDYSVDSRPVAIDGNNLCGGTPNSTKAGGTGESLGMSTQKPIKGRLVTGEMGTVSMEIEKEGSQSRGIDPKKHPTTFDEGHKDDRELVSDRYKPRKSDRGRNIRSSNLKMQVEGALKDSSPEIEHPEITSETITSDRESELADKKARDSYLRRHARETR